MRRVEREEKSGQGDAGRPGSACGQDPPFSGDQCVAERGSRGVSSECGCLGNGQGEGTGASKAMGFWKRACCGLVKIKGAQECFHSPKGLGVVQVAWVRLFWSTFPQHTLQGGKAESSHLLPGVISVLGL